MILPENLLVVRHGTSEGNVAEHPDYAHHRIVEQASAIQQSENDWRLSPEGIIQAKKTGKWILENIGTSFSSALVSPFPRALETAHYFNLSDTEWSVDRRLRERSPGVIYAELKDMALKLPLSAAAYNLIYKQHNDGESFVQLTDRVHSLLKDIPSASMQHENAILVTHGGTMHGIQAVLEQWSDEDIVSMFRGGTPNTHIDNCQILHYSTANPHNNEVSKKYKWKRSIIPWQDNNMEGVWREIPEVRHSNQTLSVLFQKAAAFIDTEEKRA